MVVHKYAIPLDERFFLRLPSGSLPLCVQVKDGAPWLWVRVQPGGTVYEHHFRLCGTGHERSDIGGPYVGSFQLPEKGLIFHLFEAERGER